MDNSRKPSELLEDALLAAEFNLNSSNQEYKDFFNLFYIELSSITTQNELKPLSGLNIEENSIEAKRALARHYFSQKEYTKSGIYWSNICQIIKKQNPSNYALLNQWQQAKYNELLSLSKLENMKDNLDRVIKILIQTNGQQMDKYWLKKITSIGISTKTM
jgi:hypothetical protein